ncbi:hypothetical protein HRR83_000979 [Exophiala dermatitidis]|uniref:HMA domain-containing protein n=1 Tax=Exophiala dermatitidis TaxID=5970 RepID=A0AAN6F4K2_EXODE|nr:hypothetical protein HRR75_000891 [Exophiala dermatitidis]KAJ4528228.1 hypothetical protein HRR74_000983 [Exophiala dermatitidis]KAJ4528861.1 hypothetical protein HRR73_001484 [Exophiala dermatitidis]KAJ4530252.1 hypothetical protein HRR76_009480 [Exophiala dermatitidis]KAJ4553187.1 hypothetical protein HRR78_003446 [Exophiala dermatitidis]
MPFTSTFLVSNIHCPSCVSYAKDVLHEVPGIQSVHVSLIDHTIRVKHEHDKTQELIVKELLKAAFEVQHVTTLDSRGSQIYDRDVSPAHSTYFTSHSTWRLSRAQRKHIENCRACQEKRARESTRKRSWTARRPGLFNTKSKSIDNTVSGDTLVDRKPTITTVDGASDDAPAEQYTATFSIGGMTCASCSGTISKELSSLEFVDSVDVNHMTNSARVVFRGPKENCDKILETIDDLGYEATLEHVSKSSIAQSRSEKDHKECRASMSIEGMTCGSCVGTITRGLEELPFVRSVNIDLVGNRGIVCFEDEQNLSAILEKIDDLGYDATVVKLEDSSESRESSGKAKERAVQIKVDGMYCEHCPEKVWSAVQNGLPHTNVDGHPAFTVTQSPTLHDPIITIVYRPAPPDFTVRSFISVINAADEAFRASVYHPPTLEERSRRLQRKEQNHILCRLIFTAIVAIPTFIIGIVYMSLVPKSNSTRQWFEEPILAGNAMRMEWALFFLTTPVMFYGTDMFHTRALKEIRSMWRPKSKVPILRRFYRFGSMNLLISAGASVAYFSSLAVLIMDATTNSTPMGHDRSSNTYFDTVTFLTFFILIGRYLEAYSKAKTGDAVAMLSKLRPADALLVDVQSGNIRQIPVDQLEVGDIVQLPHGASPPTDGAVDQEGTFLFDESSLTGESKPVKKIQGDEVYTGSLNVSDPVKIRVTEVGGTSMLDKIVDVVREGQAKRAPVERIADILTGYFVPVITFLAIITWLIWLGLGESGMLPRAWLDVSQGGWPFWSLEFAIAVFVVACPCGIGLAAPTALFVGGGLAAKRGILVQGGGEAFQEASNLDAIVFDKTGTLTEGQLRVTDFELLHDKPSGGEDVLDKDGILVVARMLEESSTHPIAKAIADYCTHAPNGSQIEPVEIKEVPGQGMRGTFKIKSSAGPQKFEAILGNERLLGSVTVNESSVSTTSASTKVEDEKETKPVIDEDFYITPILRKHQGLGQSTAIFAVRRFVETETAEKASPSDLTFHAVALFAIADPIRAEAPTVLESLRKSNLEVHMCTGDNQTTARAVAAQLGIPVTNVRAGVLPQDKAAYIRELQSNSQAIDEATSAQRKHKHKHRRIIAFVGDGTNDTPALSAADVSIALSTGSDVAVTTASFILLNSDLNTILSLVRLAKRVFLRVKLNFAWAAVYNICLVPVAAGVFFPVGATEHHAGWRLGPVWASVAMAASSVSVVLSSLALKLPEIRWRGK